MAHFFFEIHNGSFIADDEGQELADIAAARTHALRYAGQVIADEAHRVSELTEWRLEVVDADRQPVFALHLFAIDRPAMASSGR